MLKKLFEKIFGTPSDAAAVKTDAAEVEAAASKLDDSRWPSLEEKLGPYRRTCWKPVVRDGDGDPRKSKFAGIPLLRKKERWPVCPNCKNPMQLFLQLNATELPPEADEPFGEGILQLFYCTNDEGPCEVDCEAFFPFSDSVVARVVSASIEPKELTESPLDNPFPAKQIVGWKAHTDYPGWEEIEEEGIALEDGEQELVSKKGFPKQGDKLAGWAHWIQSIEYPDCPDCGESMSLIFQLDSDDNLPYMFGDVGCGHITQCSNHRHRVAFGWACC